MLPRDLHSQMIQVLSEIYLEQIRAEGVAKEAGLDPIYIAFQPRAVDNWHEILEEACEEGKVKQLLERAIAQYPKEARLQRIFADYQEWVSKGCPLEGQIYFSQRGCRPYQVYKYEPNLPRNLQICSKENISDLRNKLKDTELQETMQITVEGTLFPCALLSSGWWERNARILQGKLKLVWKDGIQEWLFGGFDMWGPSWDYMWNFKACENASENQHFIAQIGGNDEADSLPVFIPRPIALRVQQEFMESPGGCISAIITGLLGHRKQFCKICHSQKEFCEDCKKLAGGLLDYCLWIDQDKRDHGIRKVGEPELYSGYLWKCMAPINWIGENKTIRLDQLYFIWEHTNFANKDAIKYNLHALELKEKYISKYLDRGDLVLIQKSSSLVPGTPVWEPKKFYDLLMGKEL